MRDKNREKRNARIKRHKRYRKKLLGTSERPRLSVYRSLNHIYAQIIDDVEGKTIVSASSLKAVLLPESEAAGKDKEKKDKKSEKKDKKSEKKALSVKMRRSKAVGKAVAEKALEKGIKEVTFDRGGFLYHGRIAALADEIRENGLKI